MSDPSDADPVPSQGKLRKCPCCGHMCDQYISFAPNYRVIAELKEKLASKTTVHDIDGKALGRARMLLHGVVGDFEASIQHFETRGLGGQQVSFTGPFANVTPSTISEFRRWARAIREFLAGPSSARPPPHQRKEEEDDL